MTANGGLRRAGPRAVVALALLLGGISVGYAWVVARHLRDEARDTSRLLGRVFAGLNDPRPDAATNALLDLAAQVRSLGIPIAVTDAAGHVTATANAPPGADADSVALRRWIAGLDGVNAPVVQPGVGTIHYGPLPAARRFMALAVLEGAVFLGLALLAVWAYHSQVAAARDRLWVAMARESAHQLGTPLMSLTDGLPTCGKTRVHRCASWPIILKPMRNASSESRSGSSGSAVLRAASRWASARWRSVR